MATRLMEVYAGFMAHTDAQVGRLIDALEDLGQWGNTLLVYITGDNGASAEGTLKHTIITSSDPLPVGDVQLGVSFRYDGGGLGKGGDVLLRIDGRDVGSGRIERTVPYLFSMSGETLDVGATTGSPTGPYPAHFPFTGRVDTVVIDTDPQLTEEDHEQIARGLEHAADSVQ